MSLIYIKKCNPKCRNKPHSFVNPTLIGGIFKGFVSRAKALCSERYFDKESNFLVGMFVNGHG